MVHPPAAHREAPTVAPDRAETGRADWIRPELTVLPTAATAAEVDPSFFLDVLAAS